MTIFWFLLLLSPLVFFHELAHFLTAKAFNVKCEVFSLGFGPALFKKKWGETEYVISAIPLGGYVKMIGEDPTLDLAEAEKKRSLAWLPYWKKMLVVLAGPAINLIIPIFIFFFHFVGVDTVDPPHMGTVLPGMAADKSGIESGDLVLKVDGSSIDSFRQFRRIVQDSPGEKLNLLVRKPNGDNKSITLIPFSSVGRNAVGLMSRVGKAGVMLSGTIATVGIVDTSSQAYAKGIRTGDRIIGIKYKDKWRNIKFWSDYQGVLKKMEDQNFALSVVRPDTEVVQEIGLHLGKVHVFDMNAKQDLQGIEQGDLFVSSVSEAGVARRWGIKPGDRLYSVRSMKEEEPLSSCNPAKTAIGSMAQFETVMMQNQEKRLCVAWITPAEGGNCFHKAVFKQDKLSSVDTLGNRIYRHEFGLATWRKLDMPEEVDVPNSFVFGIRESFVHTWKSLEGMVVGIYYMITGELDSENVGSVVMIAQMAKVAADRGWFFFFQIMALISLNLGLLNLLPVPILDGGHALLFTIEAIARKPLSLKFRAIVSWIGLVLVLALMAYGFKNDLVRLFRDETDAPVRQVQKTTDSQSQKKLTPTLKERGVDKLECSQPPVQ
ncbi:MAG: RIP metalloprotease RseP [Deltaproteobacteria bacterium]|jgi:regulator of sigma E protease|nr:RIP metalloprotease RseP [Deltaproteobacteria bacterium]